MNHDRCYLLNEAHPVGTVEEIQTAGRKRMVIEERDIIVIAHRGQFYALDSFCYHAGGPLHQGDIEDLGTQSCVVCPWHKYKIVLSSGHGLYMAVDPFNPKKAPEMKSKGVKQRTHQVMVQQGQVFVTLSPQDHAVDSDHYNCAEYREKFNLSVRSCNILSELTLNCLCKKVMCKINFIDRTDVAMNLIFSKQKFIKNAAQLQSF